MPLFPRNPKSPREDTPGMGWIAFASVGKPHGLKGGFFLLTEDRRTTWDEYKDLRLEVEGGFEPCRVAKAYVSGGALVVLLDVLESREQVESFAGARLFVHRDEIPVGEEETLVDDLVGLRVVDEQGALVGEVSGVVSFGAQDNLLIKVPGRTEEVLFPFVEAFVLEIVRAEGYLRIRYEPAFFEES